MFKLKPFQAEAILKLTDKFLYLWKLPDQNIPLVFKSPTGSGKTIMLAQFLRGIVNDPRFYGNDVAFVWFSFSVDSYEQSKRKLFNYYGGASEINLIDLNDLSRGKLHQNDVFFINWQKIKGRSKESRRLRRENERGQTFDNFINETHAAMRKIVAIIDEEHIGSDTDLALKVVDGLIKPKITLRVSATPKYIPTQAEVGRYVGVDREEVVSAGLIKEKIIFQTEEDLKKKAAQNLDQDEMLLELAYTKRQKLVKLYKNLKVNVNPLVLIQLPNDDQANRATGNTTKQEIVQKYLEHKGVKSNEVAIWLSKEKENLEDLEKSDSPVSFLLFKQAAATGWDCPRAGVLVMFREIQNPTFAIQTVGRIIRMPFGEHFPCPELNLGYLYTNYERNEVLTEYKRTGSENRPAINGSYRRANVDPLKLESALMTRTDYNDLGDSFQSTFKQVADEMLNISELDKRPTITNDLIVDAEIDNFDNFENEVKESESYNKETSRHDLERTYDLLCFNFIAKQTDENRKYAPARSWGKLKTALNVYLRDKLKLTRADVYKVIVNDLMSEKSKLAWAINEALLRYRPIREQEVDKKAARTKSTNHIDVPRDELFFTDQYEKLGVTKSVMEPFWFEADKVGSKNEKEFIEFLESSQNDSVEWWHKNGDSGREHFAIAYRNPDESNKEKLFYPDWIIKTKTGVWIIDTKAGFTAESTDTKYKANALQAWLKDKEGLDGGIAVLDSPNGWKINRNTEYSYDTSLTGWEPLNLD